MAKDKSSAAAATLSAKDQRKAERKVAKKERKAEKLAKKGGVTKPGKKEGKKDKEKRKALAERALNELEGKEEEEEEEEGEDEEEEQEENTKMNGAAEDEDEEDEEEEEDDDEEPVVKETSKSAKKAKGDKEQGPVENKKQTLASRPVGALVPFANPLADDKVAKKVFKCVKKAAAHRTLKRGVKEVVKALRKAPSTTGPSSSVLPVGIVVLAADISPMDVISHIPVLAEDHSIPYIYVTSRAELGIAGMTKRPTSVVMVSRDVNAKKAGEAKKETTGGDDKESWDESYKALVKVVEREGRHVKV